MSKTLTDISCQLRNDYKKVQLIYAFNGSGKTRLSQKFKQMISLKSVGADGEEETELTRNKILYYNAFTEDLFYWDNDLEMDAKPKLNIQPNSFTDWILNEQGDVNIIENFQRYTDKNLTPKFIPKEEVKKDKNGRNIKVRTYPEVVFNIFNNFLSNLKESDIKVDDNNLVRRGEDENIKISKGEESNFIWSIFYTLLQEITSILKDDPSKRSDSQFNQLEYVFIDDPVSSLDDNHLIELALDLARLIKYSSFTDSKGLRFIITTHNPLFYNVLHNEFSNDLYEELPDGNRGKLVYKHNQSRKYRLDRKADGTFELKDSNDHPFSYHLFLLSELREAIKNKQIRKYHFNFLRNILEKTATFLGHSPWQNLLEKVNGHPDPFANRILNLSSHSAHSGEETADIKDKDKEALEKLVMFLIKTYGFKEREE